VGRLAREDGVTVFLTTQYLEEADVLADRVGIIDHGRIVAEGTPMTLKAEIGKPSLHAIPASDADRLRLAEALARFGDPLTAAKETAVWLEDGYSLADVVRALDQAGIPLADIETGFLSRLSLTSMRGSALLGGQLGGIVVLGLVQAIFYVVVGLVVGVRFATGPAGVLVLFLFAILVSFGFGALGSFLALRSGSGETVQGLFPALFVFLFISSMNTPRDLIAVDWFRKLATINPVSYLIECVRSLIITGWDAEALALGFGIATAIAIVSLVLASWALSRRLERT
jgi:hypothetical protein